MRVISIRALRSFWDRPQNKGSKAALSAWHKSVEKSDWSSFSELKSTFRSADQYGNKTIFDVGGNKYRVIAVIDFKHRKVFIRAVLSHKEYDKGKWKDDEFGEDWKPRIADGK